MAEKNSWKKHKPPDSTGNQMDRPKAVKNHNENLDLLDVGIEGKRSSIIYKQAARARKQMEMEIIAPNNDVNPPNELNEPPIKKRKICLSSESLTKDNRHPQNNVKVLQNTGRLYIEKIPFNQRESMMQSIWSKYNSENTKYIERVIILCGPPGAGKSRICQHVASHYNLSTKDAVNYLLEGRQMINNVMMENQHKLVESKVVEKLYQSILQNETKQKVFIVDGFLRMKRHLFPIQFLQKHLLNAIFVFLVIDVDKQTSVQRQLERGKALSAAMENSVNQEQKEDSNTSEQTRVKASDLNAKDARKRYKKYEYKLRSVKRELESVMKLDVIDGNQCWNDVQRAVSAQLDRIDDWMKMYTNITSG